MTGLDEEYKIEEIDIKKYLRLILGSWKKLLIWAAAGAVIGVIIGLSTPKTYTSTAVVAPELVTRATTGSLSTLANMAGLNINNVAMTDAMHPDLYPEIINSSSFIVGLFDMPVEFTQRDSVIHTDLYDYVVNYTKVPWYSYVINSPMIVMGLVKKAFSSKTPVTGHAEVDIVNLTAEQHRAAKMISKAIKSAVEKKTYVLNVSVTLQEPKIASALANRVVKDLTSFVINYRTSKAQQNVEYFQKVFDESKKEYNDIEMQYAEYMDAHQGLSQKKVQIKQKHLQNEVNLKYQLYNSIAQNLQQAKAKVVQESPVLVVVQPGITPVKGSPSTSKTMLAFAFLSTCIGILWVLWRSAKQKIEN